MTPRRLSRSFYQRSPQVVARGLIGKLLVHRGRAGMIVECEAYLGPEDGASHARFGPTDRNRVMFGPAGISYVFLCYGMYDMFNVVTGRDGRASAVLVRALAPYAGLGEDAAIARGPGKLCRALAITRRHDGRDLCTDPELYLARGPRRIGGAEIAVGPRVGVAYAGEWAAAPLRFYLAGHPAVSRPARPARPRGGRRPPTRT